MSFAPSQPVVQQRPSVLAWARSLPIDGNLRSFAIELAFAFDGNPDQEWIEVSDWEMAARCHVAERTIQNLQPRLASILEIDRSKGKTTRYRRPSHLTSEKVSEEHTNNVRMLIPLSLSSSSTNQTIEKKREREEPPKNVRMCPPLEELLTPELIKFADDERGFYEHETRHATRKFVLHHQSRGTRLNDWSAALKKWIFDERLPDEDTTTTNQSGRIYGNDIKMVETQQAKRELLTLGTRETGGSLYDALNARRVRDSRG